MNTAISTLELSAALDRLPEAMAFVESKAEKAGVSSTKVPGLSLAVEEAFVNICTYAYKNSSGKVILTCFPGKDAFVLEIADFGPEFNQLAVPEPDISVSIEKREIGGLGVHFIRNFTDQADWRRENSRNVLRLTIKLESANSNQIET